MKIGHCYCSIIFCLVHLRLQRPINIIIIFYARGVVRALSVVGNWQKKKSPQIHYARYF